MIYLSDKEKADIVKDKVTIPMYFKQIIVPNMPEYYSDYPVDFDLSQVVKCPLHNEDTPSMRYYDETNSFFCFGCRAGGDVIELHKQFVNKMWNNTITFKVAVEFLYSQFIVGNVQVDIGKKTDKVKTILDIGVKEQEIDKSTNIEKARYLKYVNNLELQLNMENMDIVDKMNIWKILDDTDILVNKNKVNAIVAMNYIKSIMSTY